MAAQTRSRGGVRLPFHASGRVRFDEGLYLSWFEQADLYEGRYVIIEERTGCRFDLDEGGSAGPAAAAGLGLGFRSAAPDLTANVRDDSGEWKPFRSAGRPGMTVSALLSGAWA